jgi:hypothetical protein
MTEYNSVVEGIKIGDLDFLMTLYEVDACFKSQPGQLTKSPESVQQSIRIFIDLKDIRNQQASETDFRISISGFSGELIINKAIP